MSYIGGLFTDDRANHLCSNEWLMTVPDSSMASALPKFKNAKTLQDASPELYALVADTTSHGHAWLPGKMPDGRYQQAKAGDDDAQTGNEAEIKKIISYQNYF